MFTSHVTNTRCLPRRLAFLYPRTAYRASQSHPSRRFLTLKTTSGRNLTIIKDIPISTTQNCDCSIEFPQGLKIDRSQTLINTVASYNQHLVIATDTSDWSSQIEKEDGFEGVMARKLKTMTGLKGKWFDPDYSTLISNSSFPLPPHSTESNSSENDITTSLHLFPHFLHFPHLTTSPAHLTHLLSTYLNPLPSHRPSLPSSPPPPPRSFAPPQPITKPTILICSHATRDMRCGILGPILHSSFLHHITAPGCSSPPCDVGMISHIGGHTFAGNVIVYIPPGFPLADAGHYVSPLAGMGIWYGRVEARHVPLIMEETVGKGRVIGELWRGALDGGLEGGWRERTVGARLVRVPAGLLEREGDVVEGVREKVGTRGIDEGRRVGMMGARARKRWEERQRGL